MGSGCGKSGECESGGKRGFTCLARNCCTLYSIQCFKRRGDRDDTYHPPKLVDEPSAEDVPVKEPAYNEEEANLQRALERILKEQAERTQGPARLVVIKEPDSGRIQLLPDVQGKGKEKVVDEQAAHDLLTLLTPKNKSHVDQFIFQRRTLMPTEASRHAESPSLDVELALTDSETKSDNVVSKVNTGDQDEGQARPNPSDHDKGQARPNPSVQDEGQAGSNPGDAAESQPQSSHVENLKLPYEDPMILQEPASSTGTISSLQNLKKELSFTNQFFVEKQQEEKPRKTNAKDEVQSMVSVPIHQDTSSVPPMTTTVIDLMTSQSGSPLPTSTTTASIITTTTSLPPPSQQSTVDLTLMKCIGELEKHIADLLQYNLALEESLDKHGSRLDLLAVDMKEILQQRMLKDKSYEAHNDHENLYDTLQKSLECDYANQLLSYLEEARQKKRKRRASGSSHLPPPPPSPSTAGVSGTQELSPTDSMIKDDSILDEQVHLSDDEYFGNDHLPKADSIKDWWKPLPEEERPSTLEPA
nr:hypothetical protein [Tanacetum cinerariifolium]